VGRLFVLAGGAAAAAAVAAAAAAGGREEVDDEDETGAAEGAADEDDDDEEEEEEALPASALAAASAGAARAWSAGAPSRAALAESRVFASSARSRRSFWRLIPRSRAPAFPPRLGNRGCALAPAATPAAWSARRRFWRCWKCLDRAKACQSAAVSCCVTALVLAAATARIPARDMWGHPARVSAAVVRRRREARARVEGHSRSLSREKNSTFLM
jgi:hypothetical protein